MTSKLHFILKTSRAFVQKHITFFGGLIIVMHLAGLLGLWFEPTRSLFELATPFNLLTSIILLLLAQEKYNTSFWTFIGITFFVGFFIEVIGVHTELIFGTYSYGETLGFKVFSVPLLIGVNWIMLTFIINYLVTISTSLTQLWKAVLSTSLMVLFDILIEPVAIKHDFWSWQNHDVPLQNYVGWFFVALPLCMLFQYASFEKKNSFALFLLLGQVIFFGGYALLRTF